MNIIEKIAALFDFALVDKLSELVLLDIGVIDETVASKIKQQINLDFQGYLVSIDTFSIKHIMKNHGNPFVEAQRGQIAVIKEDFYKIWQLINDFDTVRYDTRVSKSTKQIISESLVFTKDLENQYVVVKEIRSVVKRGKQNRLVLQSMWIHKKSS